MDFHPYVKEESAKSVDVICCIDDFTEEIRKGMSSKHKTIIVLDNAPIHRSRKFQERIKYWKKKGVQIEFLPPYSPELNPIEILWKFIKYKRLPLQAYSCKQSLFNELVNVFNKIGDRYRINFSKYLNNRFMKKTILLSSLLFLFCLSFTTISNANTVRDSTGFPGDHFSLEGALELFKKAQSPEDFEKLLNKENNEVNNLDLNEDGQTDYIRVVDTEEEDVHAIILQVPVNAQESQDVAVIEIEKQGAKNAILQIIGDKDVYGEEIIAEPYEIEAKQGGNGGPDAELTLYRVVVNVWSWPGVRYVYRPGYRPWVSPWRWARYPNWYKPWKPRSLRWYSGRRVGWRGHAHVVRTHRVVRAHRIYTPRRTSSRIVHTRTTTRVTARKTKNGKAVVTKKTKTRKAVKGKKGKVKNKKTKNKVRRRKN